MLKLYWAPRTRAARAVWMLEEAGADYELARIDLSDVSAKADPAFRAASPMGKVPALEDGAAKLADSAAICLYLADRFPNAGLAPALDDPLRGKYLFWMTFTPGVIEPAVMEKLAGGTPNRSRNGWGDYDSMIETLTGGVTPGPWLLGERFSAADVLVGATVQFLRQMDALPDIASLNGYAARCVERPAYRRARELEQ